MPASDIAHGIRTAAERIVDASRVCCLTGAGISAESGVPTFRGADGFWAGRRAEDLATPEAFARDPQDVWRFYMWRRSLLARKRPNPGHHALADIERTAGAFALVTQNVDGLHQAAGSENVIEIHGSLWIDRCTACSDERRRSPTDVSEEIPYCPKCASMMRPGVVWFGEALPSDTFAAAQDAAGRCDVMLVVGTSAVVQPAASLAAWARTNGAFLVEVNPEATPLTSIADIVLNERAGSVLPRIVEGLSRAD